MIKLGINDYSFAHLTLILLFTTLRNEEVVVLPFTTMNSYWAALASAQTKDQNELTYYRDVVLRQLLLPDIRAASGNKFFVFQQTMPHHIAPKIE